MVHFFVLSEIAEIMRSSECTLCSPFCKTSMRCHDCIREGPCLQQVDSLFPDFFTLFRQSIPTKHISDKLYVSFDQTGFCFPKSVPSFTCINQLNYFRLKEIEKKWSVWLFATSRKSCLLCWWFQHWMLELFFFEKFIACLLMSIRFTLLLFVPCNRKLIDQANYILKSSMMGADNKTRFSSKRCLIFEESVLQQFFLLEH